MTHRDAFSVSTLRAGVCERLTRTTRHNASCVIDDHMEVSQCTT